MNKNRSIKKNILCALLALVMVCTVAPMTGTAKAETTDTADNGEQTTYVKVKVKKTIQVRAKANGRSQIRVSWTKVRGSEGYRVYRSTSKNSGFKRVFKTKSSSKTVWRDKSRKLKQNRTYYYKVLPNNAKSLYRYEKKKVETAKYRTSSTKKPSSTTARVKNELSYRKAFTVKSTAYSGGGYCANGKKARVGRIAVDPRVIRLGTWVYVEGYGLAQACDTGGAIKGKKVDLYFNGGEKNCYRYGVKRVKLYILR